MLAINKSPLPRENTYHKREVSRALLLVARRWMDPVSIREGPEDSLVLQAVVPKSIILRGNPRGTKKKASSSFAPSPSEVGAVPVCRRRWVTANESRLSQHLMIASFLLEDKTGHMVKSRYGLPLSQLHVASGQLVYTLPIVLFWFCSRGELITKFSHGDGLWIKCSSFPQRYSV